MLLSKLFLNKILIQGLITEIFTVVSQKNAIRGDKFN